MPRPVKSANNRRGMNMRDMKRNSMNQVPVEQRFSRGSQSGQTRDEVPDDDPVHEAFDEGILVDQGDGVRVLSRGRNTDDPDRDCPDEPPPGWCET